MTTISLVRDVGYVKLSQKDTRFRYVTTKEAVMLDVMAQSRANPVKSLRISTKN